MKKSAAGFTLVEVSLAIGIASFALVTVLGALPVGLRAVQKAQAQAVAGNIAQQMQASLQQISFLAGGDAGGQTSLTIQNLPALKLYYAVDGSELTSLTQSPAQGGNAAAPLPAEAARAYYRAEFAVADPQIDGATFGVPSSTVANAQTVTVSLRYPSTATSVGPNTFVYSFLVARQRTD